MKIRKANISDIKELQKLNEAEVPHVGSIGTKNWLHFLEIASNFVVLQSDNKLAGFIITLREGKDYGSFNYQFFINHYEEFEYVDRIVVAKEFQGQGLGRKLYEYIFSRNETSIICCEVNIKPENPNSIAFHEKMGFTEKSKMITKRREKIVSLLVRKPR